jgi:hypothetical protein
MPAIGFTSRLTNHSIRWLLTKMAVALPGRDATAVSETTLENQNTIPSATW